jgi:sulfate adenylyltransferase
MIRPHGGKLVSRITSKKNAIEGITKRKVNEGTSADIVNIAHGVFSPLDGFLCKDEYEHVLMNKRLSNDVPWTIPIILDMDHKDIKELKEGDDVLLQNDGMSSILEIEEIYEYNKKEMAEGIFGTTSAEHPGVQNVYNMKKFLVGGKITLLKEAINAFSKYALKPLETRVLFREKKWKDIVAFQTRNPPHLGHEYVQKTALTFADGIFINPVIGRKKIGDFKDEITLQTYETLIKNYYLKDSAVLAILQTEMRYAGPREAVFHSIIRKNFGCTHFIVGRDHAGVGNYYPPYAAHDIFGEFPDLGIIPLFFKSFYYCKKCGGIVNEKICPHDKKDHVNFSGSNIRKLLKAGKKPPENLMRKEVTESILSFEDRFIT